MTTASKTATRTCACGAQFEYEPFERIPGFPSFSFADPTECQTCADRAAAEELVRQEEKLRADREEWASARETQVDRLTPVRLLTPDLHHRQFNGALWRKVTAWQPSNERPWLGIIGETGSCKTRCAFLRLRQFARVLALVMDRSEAVDVMVVTGPEFNRIALERFSHERIDSGVMRGSVNVSDVAAKQLRGFRDTDMLLLDELGKVRPTPAIIDELFALIDYRHSRNLCTIWTSNTMPEVFCRTWPEEFAQPGGGRIVEASVIIKA